MPKPPKMDAARFGSIHMGELSHRAIQAPLETAPPSSTRRAPKPRPARKASGLLAPLAKQRMTKKKRRQHARAHGEWPCPRCGTRFAKLSERTQHMDAKHPGVTR